MAAIWTLLGTAVAYGGFITRIDARIAAWIDAQVDGTLVTAAQAATIAGHASVSVGITVAIAAVAWRQTRRWEVAYLAIVAFVGSMAVTAVVKLVVARARPGAGGMEASLTAFPSGHSVRIAVVTGLLIWLIAMCTERLRTQLLLGGLLVALGLLVAASRVVLLVHWSSDVIGGLALGAIWLAATLSFGNRWLSDRPSPDAP